MPCHRARAFKYTPPPTDEAPPFLQRPATAVSEDLTRIKGIGPVFAERLTTQDIDTVAKVATLSPTALADILEISTSRAETILAAAQIDSN
ncbi:MAG: helix-hairpin-helix domain-containing protein [Anaerolineae bacterium]|nr:helix-hairpin-helix domain-containing protein [Anaerolineae bacterium]